MTLLDCGQGARVRVKRVLAAGAVAERLAALGVQTGEAVAVLRVSPRKRTLVAGTAYAVFALDAALAAAVEVTD